MDEDNPDILLEPLFKAQSINIGEYPESHNQHVRETAKKFQNVERQVFCEMLELCKSGEDDYTWCEQARWIKFEETVEGTKERWSKPHVPLLTLKGLLQLKNCLKRGVVLLDLNVKNFHQLVGKIVHCWEDDKSLSGRAGEIVTSMLLSNKEHVSKRRPLRIKLHNFGPMRKISSEIMAHSNWNGAADHHNLHFNGTDELSENESSEKGTNLELSKKLSENAEVACILIGTTEYVETSICAFVRLEEARSFSNCSEVNRKLRFLFVLIAPEGNDELDMIGRTLGAALTDEVFVHAAYQCQDAVDLGHAVDEMVSSSLIIPPGKWSVDSRLVPDDNSRMITRRSTTFQNHLTERFGSRKSTHEFHIDGLQYTGKIFGGLIEDVQRKLPHFISDFTSVFSNPHAFSQCVASALFLFFANFTNILIFGGIMGQMLDNQMAVIESIVSGCLSGLVFGLASGQPLNIMSATGPVLIFETLFFKFCKKYKWSFLPARFWLGTWTSGFLMLLVAFDASFLVAFITRFTEECFATLISVIFIFESIQAMFGLASKAPITTDVQATLNDSCRCAVEGENSTYISWLVETVNETVAKECKAVNGTLQGAMCKFHPDVFVFQLWLFFVTFVLAYTIHNFRTSRFFPAKVRSIIGDFNVFITILIMSMICYFVGLPIDTLHTPPDFKPTADRTWLVDVTDLMDWWLILLFALPAVFLTVLIVMDQQITAVIVNRKDNKLRKGFGYHLDLAIVAGLILICSLFGLPFFVAATILSITHVQSLRIESECSAPGERPRFLGVREQRLTTIFAHLLIGLSIFLAPIQKHIPISVLLGIFLYMGVTSMLTQQFVERILLFFTPVKYQPDYCFLRVVPLKRVFLFTALQFAAFTLMCSVKYAKPISMLFPLLLVVMVGIRKGLDAIFKQKELMVLDDILPRFRTLMKPKRGVTPKRLTSVRDSAKEETLIT